MKNRISVNRCLLSAAIALIEVSPFNKVVSGIPTLDANEVI